MFFVYTVLISLLLNYQARGRIVYQEINTFLNTSLCYVAEKNLYKYVNFVKLDQENNDVISLMYNSDEFGSASKTIHTLLNTIDIDLNQFLFVTNEDIYRISVIKNETSCNRGASSIFKPDTYLQWEIIKKPNEFSIESITKDIEPPFFYDVKYDRYLHIARKFYAIINIENRQNFVKLMFFTFIDLLDTEKRQIYNGMRIERNISEFNDVTINQQNSRIITMDDRVIVFRVTPNKIDPTQSMLNVVLFNNNLEKLKTTFFYVNNNCFIKNILNLTYYNEEISNNNASEINIINLLCGKTENKYIILDKNCDRLTNLEQNLKKLDNENYEFKPKNILTILPNNLQKNNNYNNDKIIFFVKPFKICKLDIFRNQTDLTTYCAKLYSLFRNNPVNAFSSRITFFNCPERKNNSCVTKNLTTTKDTTNTITTTTENIITTENNEENDDQTITPKLKFFKIPNLEDNSETNFRETYQTNKPKTTNRFFKRIDFDENQENENVETTTWSSFVTIPSLNFTEERVLLFNTIARTTRSIGAERDDEKMDSLTSEIDVKATTNSEILDDKENDKMKIMRIYSKAALASTLMISILLINIFLIIVFFLKKKYFK